MLTATKAAQLYQPKGDYLTSIPDEYITESELDDKNYATATQLNTKQDTLQSGTNIKTINGQSILGNGNIEIKDLSDKLIDILVTAGIIIDTRSINADTIFNATKVLINKLQ